ncbi:aminotransferase class V-fold PLP-dependent enzyme [filamentous cyanobacterium LEGE 11480]|uniref:Aminotransferase class V-fold PLP-dependent enzyme n=1 Tax=Romeriopsis navalis LEGE 11480 TaxID=2777977 RepID=A0A928Z574_9CYAN|nr:aminotransferase class V-fold PLP-dependent enzyme [Romeriopsis navalis]MBE9031742.1 aminotransferase class V-fold PLP-dependent enzyme [Romeriopsis navalis LEGE 11480]
MNHASFKQFWHIDPAVAFLNHGSFGACPIPVLDYQQSLRQKLEQQPLQFLAREIEDRLDEARSRLAQFLSASPANLVFVPNATTGINAVLRSLQFQPGDAILTTNLEYNACRNALDFVAERSGIEIIVADIPYMVSEPKAIVNTIFQAVTPNTKLVLLDHVVSQTGCVMPIWPITQLLNEQGIDTLIDGAHAPGMLPLNLSSLGATYYTGNCHKWMCSPKGAAFLYVKPDRQDQIHPTTISHGRNDPRLSRSRFHLEFDWTGTWDPSAYLSVPKAIEFMGDLLPDGWPGLMQHNHKQVLAARQQLATILDVPMPCPDSMVGSMVTLPLPTARLGNASHNELNLRLWNNFKIEVPIMPCPNVSDYLVRISSQIYNQPEDFDRLAQALSDLLQ